MTPYTVSILIRSILLGLGVFYILMIPHYIDKGTLTHIESIAICLISIVQMFAAYVLKGMYE